MNIFQILVSCSSPELAVIMNAIKNYILSDRILKNNVISIF